MQYHTVNTIHGKFRFTWVKFESYSNKTQLPYYWIAGQFLEPEKARQVWTCNPYTGKYNFHGRMGFDDPLDELMNFLWFYKEQGWLL